MNQSVARLLVVEDEPKVASFLKSGLEVSGYAVEIAPDGPSGVDILSKTPFDLIVLDVNLPGMNGIDFCRNIRNFGQNIPVLMLTALGTTKDKLAGFDAGADDYLVKPFEFTELVARIRALLKRTSSAKGKSNILTFRDLEMNLDTITVTRSGKKIDLTQKEFTLLEHFLRNKEKVVTRSEIAEKVWNIKFSTGTNVIDVYVNFLRKKVDRDFKPKLIHTLPGFGYILKTEPETDES
jgi:DNA-binding response OmpR family regulator